MSLILTALLVFALWSATSSDSSLYEEVKRLNGACSPLDNCYEFADLRRRNLFWRRKCDCGPHCVRFGTCCASSTFAGKFVDELQPNEECLKPTGVSSGHYWMVSKCAADWKKATWVVNECEKEKTFDGDSLSKNIPVTSIGTLVTYKNYYCALCNFGGDDFVRWKTFLRNIPSAIQENLEDNPESYVNSSIFYNVPKKGWEVFDKKTRETYDIGINFVLPSYLNTKVGYCQPGLIRKCLASHTGSELQEKCNAYYMPIAAKNGKGATAMYRNVHCAMCNNVPASNIVTCSPSAQQSVGNSKPPSGVLADINDYGDKSNSKHEYFKIRDP